MPWNDQSGGGDRNQGPWGAGPRRPWGQSPPRQPQQPQDLDEMLRRMRERFSRRGGGGEGGAREGRGPGAIGWPVIVGVLAVGWLMSGLYIVDEGENAVITTFGKYTQTTAPGLHWHIPAPIQARQVVNVTGQRTDEIGCTTRGEECQDNPSESLMITGDRNIVEIHFRIYYNINNVVDFVFNVRNPAGGESGAVRQLAESAMREVIGGRQLEPIITTDRAAVEQAVEDLMQQTLDEYGAGVRIVQVQLLSAAAPPTVIDAFNDVVDARSDAETATNNAQREAARISNEAQAYRERVVREATGEAQRFTSVYEEYRAAPQVTRDRLYLEAMERVLRNADVMIIDQNGGAVPYLPLDNLRRSAPPAAQQQGGGG